MINLAGDSALPVLGKACAIVFVGFVVIVITFSQTPVFGAMFAFIFFLIAPLVSLLSTLTPLVFMIFEITSLYLVYRRLQGALMLIWFTVLISAWEVYGWYCANEYIGT